MSQFIQVHTSTDTRETALSIGQRLVELRLAACVHVSGPITSIYRWQGQVETATEWSCAVKTTAELFADVEQQIRQMHSYAEPEICAVNITAISASYGIWLRDQVTRPDV